MTIIQQKGKRLFITGIPASGKSYLAKELAVKTGGIVVSLDNAREKFFDDDYYKKWVMFYFYKNEKEYLTQTPPEELWDDLVKQSEALFPIFKSEIEKYHNETRPVIFECVNLLPHIADQELYFSGVVMLGDSFETILERNKKDPRWGETEELQELEAREFFYVERPRYKKEAEKYGYPTFENYKDALEEGIRMIT
jgi:2-phosphoglycerate kinase